MNEEFCRWYMYGHWVCVTQWLGFIMVEYAYLGKGRVKHPLVWSCVLTVLTMTLSVVCNFGFFTPQAEKSFMRRRSGETLFLYSEKAVNPSAVPRRFRVSGFT